MSRCIDISKGLNCPNSNIKGTCVLGFPEDSCIKLKLQESLGKIDTDYNKVRRAPEECTPENDALRVLNFSDEMYAKWQKGRGEHGTVVRIDPLEEAMKECVDGANYFMDAYYRIKKLREKLLGSGTQT